MLREAAVMFDRGLYRAAIATGAVFLEHSLQQSMDIFPSSGRPMSLRGLLAAARNLKILEGDLAVRLEKAIKLRNLAVHALQEPTREDAEFVLSTIREVLEKLPKRV